MVIFSIYNMIKSRNSNILWLNSRLYIHLVSFIFIHGCGIYTLNVLSIYLPVTASIKYDYI